MAQAEIPARTPTLNYRGTVIAYRWCIDVYLALLSRLWTDFPSHRQLMAQAVSARGRERAYVARSPGDLFYNQTVTWAEEHSRQFADGWYADTNLNPLTMPELLRAAVGAVGLRWGEDVQVSLPPSKLRAIWARNGEPAHVKDSGDKGCPVHNHPIEHIRHKAPTLRPVSGSDTGVAYKQTIEGIPELRP